ncbi:MAG: SOS response-associated peptidase [Candidatus Rokubacteria bacterium]|nr:SOS response-associated peptidase [Candidatus Rokubacteria bacterium]
MCGRYTQTAAFDELALRFGITVEDAGLEDLPPRYNVAPSQSVPIVVAHNGGRPLVMAKWGFHPVWMKTSKLAPINAKAETVANAPETCTIITTTPNDLVAAIHNRMPVILKRDDEVRWTDAHVTDPAAVLPCLRPLPAELMEGYPVSTLVSSPGNEGPRLVQPVS